MKQLLKTGAAAALFLISFSCDQGDDQSLKPLDDSPIFMELPTDAARRLANGRTAGSNLQIFSAEYLTSAESGQIGRTVYFKDVGNKQLDADFVPGINLDGTDNVSYYIDQTRPSEDISVQTSSAAIERAMNTWDGLTCSDLGLFRVPSDSEIKTGFVSEIFGFGGSFDYTADLVHAGWLPAAFFNMLAPPDGSTYILAVTFTIIFTDDDGNATDIDNNGKADVALREIYYNEAFKWADGSTYDIETIALHEAGHGLSQGHFGQAFRTNANGKLHFAPRAVMNAAYSGVQTTIRATDNGGHCSNWSSWPNN